MRHIVPSLAKDFLLSKRNHHMTAIYNASSMAAKKGRRYQITMRLGSVRSGCMRRMEGNDVDLSTAFEAICVHFEPSSMQCM